jgi:hypothetical protein
MGIRVLPLTSLLGVLCLSNLALGAESEYGSALSLPGSALAPPAGAHTAPAISQPSASLGNAHSLPAPSAKPLPQPWQLRRDALLHEELTDWAGRAGWQLLWQPGVTWRVAADASFLGEFPDAIASVIENLYLEGRPVRLVLWEGNKVAEVVSHEVR